MLGIKVKKLLDVHRIPYTTILHPLAFTAQGIAAATHISGRVIAKSVIIKMDGRMVMVVLPANMKVDFFLIQEALGAEKIELASEREFRWLFPDCEIGAMPPFGSLYGLEVYVEQSLTEDEYIAFNAGTHRELIKLSYHDFERLVRPRVMHLSAMAV